jgi:cyanophycin synthetase
VKVKTVCNENAAFDNHVARETIHPALARIGAEFVRRLGLRLAGVDVMAADPSRPPEAGGLVFNEVNANPGLHHHWLVAETERRAPVGALVLQAALS